MVRAAVLLTVLAVSVCILGTAQETLDEALALFDPNGDIHVPFSDEGRAQLSRIINRLREALGVPEYLNEESESEVGSFAVAPQDKDLVTKLSQAYYSCADAFLRGLPTQRATFLKGKQWGFKSLRMNPAFAGREGEEGFAAAARAETDVAALFWANANWLRWAEPNILDAIKAGIAQKSLAMSERALELEPSYAFYGSYRALSGFWQGLPSDPITPVLFTGGLRQDYETVRFYLCAVVDEPSVCGEGSVPVDASCTGYFENRVALAQYYLMPLKYWDDAERVLQSVLDEPIGGLYPLYNGLNQRIAAELLIEVRKHL